MIFETVFDHRGFAAANGDDGESDDEVRASKGDKFPKCNANGAASRKKSAWLCAAPP